jgi:outer membrane receptor protein involved in Fe transport
MTTVTVRDAVLPRAMMTASATAVVMAAALAASNSVYAQAIDQATDQTAQPSPPTSAAQDQAALEEIVVSGTRIIRNGYESPTPVSVLTTQDLNSMALPNIADAVNRMPEVSGSSRPTTEYADDITLGVNNINLRALGPDRTLVLLDGQRLVASTIEGFNHNGGAVDVNVIPNNLIQRVDIVTGGASAVYGSDALAGVVNFILDREFTGVRGGVEGGVTTYGDDANYKGDLALGTAFGGGKGHLLLSVEAAYNNGVDQNNRPWNAIPYLLMENPNWINGVKGVPELISTHPSAMSIATGGGLVFAGPLAGTMFGPGGVPSTFHFGAINNFFLMQGGDWQQSRIDQLDSLDLVVHRTNAFARASYDITENIQLFTQLQWSDTFAKVIGGVPQFALGSISVNAGNPFIPPSIAAQMAAQGIASLPMGSNNFDLDPFIPHNDREFRRYVLGAGGKIGNSGWKWDAYYSHSTEHITARIPGDMITANYTNAIDAVLDPATGQIVCRSTLANPNDGCVAYNAMGIGVNSQQAINYVTGQEYATTLLTQDVAAVSATAEPFSSWAGPVSIALDVEHRDESVSGTSDPIGAAAGYFAGNYTATFGSYSVTEGSFETVIPLAKDYVAAKALDINGAVRFTDYTTSGSVVTWKAGLTYKPIDDITLRATRSRDIRAPNLGDLYNAGRSGTGAVFDPVTNQQVSEISRVEGNPNLDPEDADTTGVGIVLQPSFMPGFQASVDYYKIDITGAIETLNEQEIVDGCYLQGLASLCPFIHRNAAGVISFIEIKPANILAQNESGIDFEASYNMPLAKLFSSGKGALALRGFATHISSLETIRKGGTLQGAGVNSDDAGNGQQGLFAPHWRYTLSASYAIDPWVATYTVRGVGAGVYNNSFIVCTANCPASTVDHPTIDQNHIASVVYMDLSLTYKMNVFGGTADWFVTVENFLNRDPPLVYGGTDNGFYQGQDNSFGYDRLGRFFHTGIRFKL